MARPSGGWISGYAVPTPVVARGAWSLRDMYQAQTLNQWPGIDPSFSSVTLLLGCEGTNNSTTFTDSSGTPKTVTAVGDAKISTTRSKFGSSSGYCDGTGDYVTATGQAVGSGNFTIESWVYINSLQSSYRTFWAHRSSEAVIGGALLLHTGGSVRIFISNSAGTGWQVSDFSPSLSVSTGAWTHLALVRDGNTIRSFVNGSAGTTTTVSTGTIATSGDFSIMSGSGSGSQTQTVDAYWDEFRVTLGVARYTSSFTPVEAPFPTR